VRVIICAQMRILVTGASGFVGGALVPRLRREGHSVRAFGRDQQRLREALARGPGADAAGVELAQGDAVSGEGLRAALEGVEVAYYLIHSMERAAATGPSFQERERTAAENFGAAAANAGVRRIVYLGGLLPHWQRDAANGALAPHAAASRHLESLEQVERILLAAVPDSVALRASIVIGARSRSFRLLVRLVERMPLLALPTWESYRTQPIDERDVIGMLITCAHARTPRRSLEVGGPDVLSYGEMIRRIADIMLVARPALSLPVSMTALTARVAAAIAGEDPDLVIALMEGLRGDLLPDRDDAAALLGVRLHSFDSAVEHALAQWELSEPLAAR
jgi:uncharacterized protein YbjT (DUF2867 family)